MREEDEIKSYTRVFERPVPNWAQRVAFLCLIGPLFLVGVSVAPGLPWLYPFQEAFTRAFVMAGDLVDRLTSGWLPGPMIVVATLACLYALSLLLGVRALSRRWGHCRVTPWGLEFKPPYYSQVIAVPAERIAGHRETDAGFELDMTGRSPFAAALTPLLVPLQTVEERRAAQTLLDAFQDRSPPAPPAPAPASPEGDPPS